MMKKQIQLCVFFFILYENVFFSPLIFVVVVVGLEKEFMIFKSNTNFLLLLAQHRKCKIEIRRRMRTNISLMIQITLTLGKKITFSYTLNKNKKKIFYFSLFFIKKNYFSSIIQYIISELTNKTLLCLLSFEIMTTTTTTTTRKTEEENLNYSLTKIYIII